MAASFHLCTSPILCPLLRGISAKPRIYFIYLPENILSGDSFEKMFSFLKFGEEEKNQKYKVISWLYNFLGRAGRGMGVHFSVLGRVRFTSYVPAHFSLSHSHSWNELLMLSKLVSQDYIRYIFPAWWGHKYCWQEYISAEWVRQNIIFISLPISPWRGQKYFWSLVVRGRSVLLSFAKLFWAAVVCFFCGGFV